MQFPFELRATSIQNIIENCESEEEMLQYLNNTKHFDQLLLKQNKDNILIYGTQVPERNVYSAISNKKRFLGLQIKSKTLNFSNNLDLLEVKFQHDFPFFNSQNMGFQGLRQKYFDKTSLKVKYHFVPLTYKKPITIELVKGKKVDYNYLAFRTKIKNFISIGNKNIDASIGMLYKSNACKKIKGYPEVKLKYKKSTINRSNIPNGKAYKVQLNHAFLSTSNEFTLKGFVKKFFSLQTILPQTSLEIDSNLILTSNPENLSCNLLGFRETINQLSNQSIYWEQFSSIKFNFYNQQKLEANRMNFFLYASELSRNSQKIMFRYGLGLQKDLNQSGRLEFCYDFPQNCFQLRFLKDFNQFIKMYYFNHQFFQITQNNQFSNEDPSPVIFDRPYYMGGAN